MRLESARSRVGVVRREAARSGRRACASDRAASPTARPAPGDQLRLAGELLEAERAREPRRRVDRDHRDALAARARGRARSPPPSSSCRRRRRRRRCTAGRRAALELAHAARRQRVGERRRARRPTSSGAVSRGSIDRRAAAARAASRCSRHVRVLGERDARAPRAAARPAAARVVRLAQRARVRRRRSARGVTALASTASSWPPSCARSSSSSSTAACSGVATAAIAVWRRSRSVSAMIAPWRAIGPICAALANVRGASSSASPWPVAGASTIDDVVGLRARGAALVLRQLPDLADRQQLAQPGRRRRDVAERRRSRRSARRSAVPGAGRARYSSSARRGSTASVHRPGRELGLDARARAARPNRRGTSPRPLTSTTIARRPRRAASRPSAAASVERPTPPLPSTKTRRRSSSRGRRAVGVASAVGIACGGGAAESVAVHDRSVAAGRAASPAADAGGANVRARSDNLFHRRPRVKDSRQAVRITPRVGLHPTTERPVSRDGEDHRVRQPEGRRRQDDDDAQPRRRVRGGGPPRALRRHGPAGQPDDVAGHRPRLARAVDVRRARAQDLDPRGDPQARDRRRLRLDRPRRRRDRDGADDRPRARAAAGLRADPRGLRLHLHRHAAEPRAC